mmetsp:Transcript_7347/g.18417  ORF Transcript_7347/g.18417 Transcript_7347/m.18417 type:complete len:287 (+) Transcript_7347:105-965(+)
MSSMLRSNSSSSSCPPSSSSKVWASNCSTAGGKGAPCTGLFEDSSPPPPNAVSGDRSTIGLTPGPDSSNVCCLSSSSKRRMISSKSASNCGVAPMSSKAPSKGLPLVTSSAKPSKPSSKTGRPETTGASRCGASARAMSLSSICASSSTVRGSLNVNNGPLGCSLVPAEAPLLLAGPPPAALPLPPPAPMLRPAKEPVAEDGSSTICTEEPRMEDSARRASFGCPGLRLSPDFSSSARGVSRSFFGAPLASEPPLLRPRARNPQQCETATAAKRACRSNFQPSSSP